MSDLSPLTQEYRSRVVSTNNQNHSRPAPPTRPLGVSPVKQSQNANRPSIEQINGQESGVTHSRSRTPTAFRGSDQRPKTPLRPNQLPNQNQASRSGPTMIEAPSMPPGNSIL